MMINEAQPYREQVNILLEAQNLPVADLPESLENFYVTILNGEVIGVAGIEIFGNYGLLRSVAVHPNHRGLGIAGNLISRVESVARLKKLSALYLLTETAPAYFKNKGFDQVSRGEVPTAVQASSEFSHVCPASAIVMKKLIS